MVRVVTNIVDKELADDQQQTSWPFTSDSTFQTSLGLLTYPCFNGALLYPFGEFVLPYRIKTVVGNASYITVNLVDAEDTSIGSADCYSSSLCAKVLLNGITAGVLGYTQEGLEYLRSFVSGNTLTLSRTSLMFSSDICLPQKAMPGYGISIGDTLYTGAVSLCASGGIRFDVDGSSVSVNMYGEIPTMEQPITSINGSTSDEVWLAAIPGSGVRVETLNSTITYGKASDYGTVS